MEPNKKSLSQRTSFNTATQSYSDKSLPFISNRYGADRRKSGFNRKKSGFQTAKNVESFEDSPTNQKSKNLANEESAALCLITEDEMKPDIASLMEQYNNFDSKNEKGIGILRKYKIEPKSDIQVKSRNSSIRCETISYSSNRKNFYFSNPAESEKTLEKNKEIYSRVKDIVTSKLSSNYIEKFEEHSDHLIKSNKMNEVNVKIKYVNKTPRLKQADFTTEFKKNFVTSRKNLLNNLQEVVASNMKIGNTRLGACMQMTIALENKKYWIFGGTSHVARTDLFCFDLKSKAFFKVPYKGHVTKGRVGATMVGLNENLYIFGGTFEEYSLMKINLTARESHLFDIPDFVSKRKHHMGLLVGNLMIIFGGFNKAGKVLNDGCVIELETQNYQMLPYKKIPPTLAHMASALVVPKSRIKKMQFGTNLFNVPESDAFEKLFSKEGIYMFGGIRGDGLCSNVVYCAEIGYKSIDFKKLKISGEPPRPRFGASMTFIEDYAICIVHGGSDSKQCFDDTFLLDLEMLQWQEIKVFSNDLIPRLDHIALIARGRLLILGGLSDNIFPNSDFFTIDLESSSQNEMKESETNNMKRKYKTTQDLPTMSQVKKQSTVANLENTVNRLLQVKLIKRPQESSNFAYNQ